MSDKSVKNTAENILIVGLCIVMLTSIFIIKPFKVSGESMDTTYHDKQRVFVYKLAYKDELPERGDVIVFKQDGNYLIKRVIGLPGDTVAIKEGITYVNGEEIKEGYIQQCSSDNMMDVNVEGGQVFVMGDNRPNSLDSRSFGCVDLDNVTGKVIEREPTKNISETD